MLYNTNYSYYGISMLNQSKFQLAYLRIEYCTKIGDESIEVLTKKYRDSLKEFHLIRNCYEKCSKISDKSINYLKKCSNLEQLTFIYVRKFSEEFHIHLSSMKNLKYLNLTDCPILEDLSILNEGCPRLEEVNMSGDSWIRKITVLGLSKHKNIKIFHLGHLEHSDNQCDKGLGEFPPKGVFIETLFKKPEAFVSLKKLYLEQVCGLTYWLDIRLKKIRPTMEIRYTLFKSELDFGTTK